MTTNPMTAEIVSYLQATAPHLATKLTLERLEWMRVLCAAESAARAQALEEAAILADEFGYGALGKEHELSARIRRLKGTS